MSFGQAFAQTYGQAQDRQLQRALQLAQQIRDQNNFENQQADNARADEAQSQLESYRQDQLQAQKDWRDEQGRQRQQQLDDMKAAKEVQAAAQKASLKQKKFDAVTRYAESLSGRGYSDNQIDTLVKRHQKRIEDMFPEEGVSPNSSEPQPSGPISPITLGQGAAASVPAQQPAFPPMAPMGGPEGLPMMGQPMGQPMGQGPADFLNQPPPSFQDKLRNTASVISHRVNQDAQAQTSLAERKSYHKTLLRYAADRLDLLADRADTDAGRAEDYHKATQSLIEFRKTQNTLADLRRKLGEKNFAMRQKEFNVRIGQKGIDETLKINAIAGKYDKAERASKTMLDGYDEQIATKQADLAKIEAKAKGNPSLHIEALARRRAVDMMLDKRATLNDNYEAAKSDKEDWVGVSQGMMKELHDVGVITYPKAGSGLSPQTQTRLNDSVNRFNTRRSAPAAAPSGGKTDYSKLSTADLLKRLAEKAR